MGAEIKHPAPPPARHLQQQPGVNTGHGEGPCSNVHSVAHSHLLFLLLSRASFKIPYSRRLSSNTVVMPQGTLLSTKLSLPKFHLHLKRQDVGSAGWHQKPHLPHIQSKSLFSSASSLPTVCLADWKQVFLQL